MLEAALTALPETDTSERARLLATLCAELLYRITLDRRLALADEAQAMARRVGDPATLIDVLNRCSSAIRFPSTAIRQFGETAEAISLALAIDDPARLFSASLNGAICALFTGQFDMVAEHLTRVQTLAERLRQPQMIWEAEFMAALHALTHGDAVEAERRATVALEVGTASGQPDSFSFYGTQLMGIRNMQGRYGEMVPLIVDVAEKNPALPAYRAVLAVAHLEAGDEDAARTIFDEAAATSFRLPEDTAWSTGIVRYARVAIELEIGDHAGGLFELLAPFHDQVPHNGLTPTEPVAMYLGGLATVLGRYDDAEGYFAEAHDLNTRGGMRFAEAHNNLLWGRMLRTRGGPGDADRARALLTQARNSAATQGYASVERRSTAALSELV